ncbi:MAG: choline kinase [Planctomycetota bacterium]|jgi:choline kinase
MNLFILAAGKGTRLYPLTKDRPKSLIELNDGSTILERQIEVALESGAFDSIQIITGYLTQMIEECIEKYSDRSVEVIYNPYYDVSNNLFSLWTAHYMLREKDFMISNGDNIYRRGIYSRVLDKSPAETIQITVDVKDTYDDDDMKVTLNKLGHVTRVSKKISPEAADRESLGLVLVRGPEHRRMFYDQLMKLVRDQEMMGRFWLEIFNFLADAGQVIETCDVPEKDWAEIDFHPDIHMLQKAITAKLFD